MNSASDVKLSRAEGRRRKWDRITGGYGGGAARIVVVVIVVVVSGGGDFLRQLDAQTSAHPKLPIRIFGVEADAKARRFRPFARP